MGQPSDNEATTRFADADLERVMERIEAAELVDDYDEDEGATEIVQHLDVEDLQMLEGDSGLFSLEEPDTHSDPGAPGRLMPHTPRGAAQRGVQADHTDLVLLGRVLGLGMLVGMSLAVAGWWFFA